MPNLDMLVPRISIMPSFKSTVATSSNMSLAGEGKQQSASCIVPLPVPLDSRRAHFFQLPLRVRKEIYRHAVVPGKVFVRPFLSFRKDSDENPEHCRFPNMQLFTACRKIYEEICPLFYQENTFSFLHPDVILDISNGHPRLRDHLKHMHKVEVMFHHQDFQYFTGAFCDELLTASIALKRYGNHKGKETEKMARNLLKYRAAILGAKTYTAKNGRLSPNTGPMLPHAQDIKSMQDYFFGRTLTFLRQRLLISKLELKFLECNCAEGCCRLAGEILNWGTQKTWTFDLPRSISVTGATEEERRQILETIAHQRPSPMIVDLLLKSQQNRRKSFTNRSLRGILKAMDLGKR